jgi:hypothetical protein
LKKDLVEAKKKAGDYVKKNLDKDFSKLTTSQQEALTDFTFYLGSLEQFPNCTKAVVDSDLEKAKEECVRKYVPKGCHCCYLRLPSFCAHRLPPSPPWD